MLFLKKFTKYSLIKNCTINFGPQHPAAHGVLRLILELEGEIIKQAFPHIGLLHRGTEKLLETKTIIQGLPYFDRLDYISLMAQEHAYALALEKLMHLNVPLRAQYIRVLFVELSRLLNHMLAIGSHALDIGAMTPMLWFFEEREKIFEFYERVSGARMHANFFCPGGIIQDLPQGLSNDIKLFCLKFKTRLDEIEELLTQNRIWKQRLIGIGIITSEQAQQFGFSGVMLRGSGFRWDLRLCQPYEIYSNIFFQVPIGRYGDCYDRYLIRMEEMRESLRIIIFCLDHLPKGFIRTTNKHFTLLNKKDFKISMEKLINHFKFYGSGISMLQNETYTVTESPKGEFGVFLISEAQQNLFRCRIKSPSFLHLQSLPFMIQGHLIADVVTVISSQDIVFGEIDR